MVLKDFQENPVILDQELVINIKMLFKVLSTTKERAKQDFYIGNLGNSSEEPFITHMF